MKTTYKTYTLALCLILFIYSSCKKFVEVNPPATQLTAGKVFDNDATAVAALSNIYYECINGNFADGGLNSVTFLAGLSSDELENISESTDLIQINSNQILASNASITNIWNSCYHTIYESNALLEGIKSSTRMSETAKDQLTGEGLFLRAFAQLNLCSLFGDVPLANTTNYRINSHISRSRKAEVIQSVITDLNKAIPLLNTDYNAWKSERVRANQWAAKALLARAFLYQGDWENAAQMSSQVIQNSVLYEVLSPDKVFLKNSREAIWQLKPEGLSFNTTEGNLFILNDQPYICTLRSDFIQNFEAGDQRAIQWIGQFSQDGESWYYPYKYKISQGGSPLNEYSMVLRISEQYLIHAEAQVRLDQYKNALDDLNILRLRHGGLTIPLNKAVDRNQCLDLVLHERQVELFMEWGHRWIDLNRFGKTSEVLESLKPGWINSAVLYPIPQTELTANTALLQNPGYH